MEATYDLLLFLGVVLALILFCYKIFNLIVEHGFTKRDGSVLFLVFIGIVVLGNFISEFDSIRKKMSTKFTISNEFVTQQNTQDSIINDSILYDYLKQMRVPHAKIILAQAKLESNSYKSELFKSNFNLFGMKVATIRTSNTSSERNGYQAYCNWRESVMDYVLWQFSNNVDKLSDKEYFDYLSEKYAEDPKYIEKLKNLIR